MNRYSLTVLALALLAVTSTGCSNHPGTHYTVFIDPAFSSDDQESALRAVDDWRGAVPDLTIEAVIGHCSGIHTAEICVHPGDDNDVKANGGDADSLGVTATVSGFNASGETSGSFGIDGGEIWIDMDRIAYAESVGLADAMQETIAHEMGHAMGLRHTSQLKTLMYPDANSGDQTVGRTCDDMSQWYAIRNMVSPGCAAPER